MENPYKVTLGEMPEKYIEDKNTSGIVEGFCNDETSICILLGPSGSGKTVAMTVVSKELNAKNDWIVIKLNPRGQLLEELVAKLYDSKDYVKEFVNAELNLSKWGIGVDIKTNPPASNLEASLSKILRVIKKKGKKLMVCVDEVIPTSQMRCFLNSVQTYVVEGLPFKLLLAGLYEDIDSLRKEGGLTFLNRIPSVNMGTLDLTLVAKDYLASFNINNDKAAEFAAITKGFPTAYQLLGQLLWQEKKFDADDEMLDALDKSLYSFSYKELIEGFNSEEIAFLQMISNGEKIDNSNRYSSYKNKLLRSGVIESKERGKLEMKLPRFNEVFRKATIDCSLW